VRVVAAAALVLVGIIWLRINKSFEGPTLVILSTNHGITAADLISALLFLVAAWIVLKR
jgi:hypothetical protein